MNVLRLILALALLGGPTIVRGADTLFVFVFKDGLAQSGIEVVAGPQTRSTNEFGFAAFELPADDHEIGYFKDGTLFALTEVALLDGQQSQIFLTLTRDGHQLELDLPLAAYRQDFDEAEVRPQSGPKGRLIVQARDVDTQQPIAGARLFFRGYAVDALTDATGVGTIDLAAGEYDISVIHPNYQMRVLRDVRVNAETTANEAVELARSNIVLDEFVVTAPSVEGSFAASLTDLKDSDVFADAISSEQFSKSGDSSASSALKRVTGITVLDGKFVFVRGLGERYSTVMLNDLTVPSPEPTKRVVPLDIFPTDVIQSMTIQKTYSSDLPGNFGGGAVLIETKDIPEEDNFIQGSVGLSYNDNTGALVPFNNDNNKGLPTQILRFSDDFGVLTQEVRLGATVIAEGLSAAEKDALNRAMVNYRSYAVRDRRMEPGKSASLALGQSFKTRSGMKYGVAGSLYYKTDETSSALSQDEFQFDPDTGDSIHIESAELVTSTVAERYGGLVSVGLDDLDKHKLKYTLLSLSESESVTNFGQRDRLVEGDFQERSFLQYIERQLTAHQFNGRHRFEYGNNAWIDDLVIEWGAATAEATRREPGTFEYEYKQAGDDLVLDAKTLFYLYSDMADEVDNYRVDFTLPQQRRGQDNHTRFGFFTLNKQRDLDNRRFKIKYDDTLDPRPIDTALSEASIDAGILDVLDSYRPDDFYTANQDVNAFYFNQVYSLRTDLDLIFGLRQESSTQSLRVGADADEFDLETSDLLPAAGLTWRLDDEQQLRLAYSRTITRPDFREFSPNRFKDPLTGYIIFGFAGLEPTTIDNLDLKYEWYPSFDEFLTLALFSKQFTNPIETVRNIKDVDIETSFRNADSASSIGLEFGFRKNLEKLSPNLKHFFISGNYALIESKITLDKDSPENANDQFIPFLTSEERSMQGQSPYVLNLKFGYDNFFTRRSAALLYNVFGRRITALGIDNNPDIYEQPFHKLDFVLKWGLNDTYDEQVKKIGYTLSFKAGNLLDSDIIRRQGDEDTLRISPGRSFSLSFSAKL